MPKVNPILQFVDKMMEQSGFTNLPEDTRKEYRIKLAGEAQKRLMLVSLEKLPSDKAQELSEHLSQNPDDADFAVEFFMNNIADYEKYMTEVLVKFAQEFTESVRKMS